MAVRFLPVDGQSEDPRPDRSDLAEVVELRSKLSRAPSSKADDSDLAGEADEATDTAHSGGAVAEVLSFISATGGQTPTTQPVSEADVHEESVQQSVPEPTAAYDDAVKLLARRARSSGELRRELVLLGHSDADAEVAVLECETSLYLDDLGLARALTEKLRHHKRASRSQVRMKLRERQLPDGVIEEALSELDDDEEHELLAVTAAERARKMTGLDRQTAERRLLGFLARRGWSGERATRAAREALDGVGAAGSVGAGSVSGGSGRFGQRQGRSSVRFE